MNNDGASAVQNITVEIQGPHSETSLTREKRYAYGERGGRLSLIVSRERDGYMAIWNVDRGRGWQAKNWKKSKMTEVQAKAFVEEKWSTLMAWLEKLEPVARTGGGAAAAFSAQVAAMQR